MLQLRRLDLDTALPRKALAHCRAMTRPKRVRAANLRSKKAKTAGNYANNKEHVSLHTNQRLELTLKEINPLLPAPCTVPPDKAQHEHGEHENDVHIILSTLQHWYDHPEAGSLDTAEA